ncbi:uncharacterized protein LOC122012705 isoform X2 [Zingiber officinale]|uniref:uncharacterized protein LOC122001601 isoform X2 n=1 Tax=Zingiber officinale TaxID=94328 RepID=UPI001C4C8662|nr:uncharacterized protein LOC122001601 isoform X2 [Zingiber officinale]XP_042425267.1 uncharacterized protein LOC122012705 isoform X2 [Zingiber officinale]
MELHKLADMLLRIQLSHGLMNYFAWLLQVTFQISLYFHIQVNVPFTMSTEIYFSNITRRVRYVYRFVSPLWNSMIFFLLIERRLHLSMSLAYWQTAEGGR